MFDLLASPYLSTLLNRFLTSLSDKSCIYPTISAKLWTFTPQVKVLLAGKWDRFLSRHFKFGASIDKLSLVCTVWSKAGPSQWSLKGCRKGNSDEFKSNKMHVQSDDQSHYTWDQFHLIPQPFPWGWSCSHFRQNVMSRISISTNVNVQMGSLCIAKVTDLRGNVQS